MLRGKQKTLSRADHHACVGNTPRFKRPRSQVRAQMHADLGCSLRRLRFLQLVDPRNTRLHSHFIPSRQRGFLLVQQGALELYE